MHAPSRLAVALFPALLASSLLAAPAPAQNSLAHRELLLSFDDVAGRIVQLAEAMPAEKYSWRPAEGVRSVGEVYVHIANGNRLILAFATGRGMTSDQLDKLRRDYADREHTLTDKAAIIADLKDSLAKVRQAIVNSSTAELQRPLKLFGETSTVRGAFISIIGHMSEHLGQSIAYARINGIVPPWSRGQ